MRKFIFKAVYKLMIQKFRTRNNDKIDPLDS